MSRREDRYTTTEADAGEYERRHNMDARDDDTPSEADLVDDGLPLALTEGRVVEVPDLGGVWRAIGGAS
jgi:hypothetical protein